MVAAVAVPILTGLAQTTPKSPWYIGSLAAVQKVVNYLKGDHFYKDQKA